MSALRKINRQTVPHLRCGLCQEEFEPADDTVYVDDERCHRECVEIEEQAAA